MASDGTHSDTLIARASALMAGNGVILLQILLYNSDHPQPGTIGRFLIALILAISVVGLFSAYGMMLFKHRRSITRILEIISAGGIALLLTSLVLGGYHSV